MEVDDVEQREKIKVWIEFKDGKTVCICKRDKKKCSKKKCVSDVVERDKFYGWEQAFRQNRYGK